MKKLFVIGLIALMFASCYEDKGNYDYKKVMLIEAVGSSTTMMYPENKQCIIGEEFTYYPPLKFINYESPEDTTDANLEFTWCSQDLVNTNLCDTIATGRHLKWVCDRMAGTLNVYLFIKDKKNNYETRLQMQLKGMSNVSKGWAFLHSYGGKTDMSFIRPYWLEREDPEDPTHKIKERHYALNENFLTRANPEGDFGTNPTNMVWYGNSSSAKIMIFQDVPCTIDGPTWKHDMDLAEEFQGGLPNNGKFKDMIFTSGAAVLLATDGKVYRKEHHNGSSGQGEYQEFFITPYVNVPLQDITTGKDLEVEKFQPWCSAWRGNTVSCYDKVNGRILYSYPKSGRNASDVYAVPYSSKKGEIKEDQYRNKESMNLYVDLADLGEWTLQIAGQKGESYANGYNRSKQVFLLKNPEGKMLIEMVDVQYNLINERWGVHNVYRPKFENIDVREWTSFEGATDDMINENTVHYFCEGYGGTSYSGNSLFFAKDNIIYCLDFDAFKLYKYYEYPAGTVIKFMHGNPRDTELGVYTSSDNTFRTFNITAEMLNNPDYSKKIVGEVSGLKDVVRMKYFYPNHVMGYGFGEED